MSEQTLKMDPTKIYETDFCRITNEDNMDMMKRYNDKHFDLAIVDPPYGISINMNMGRKAGKRKKFDNKKWDDDIPSSDFFDELFRVSKNQIIWGGNYFPLPGNKHFIFWDKQFPKGLSFSDGEYAWTSFDRANKKVALKVRESKYHPTGKPISLYEYLLANYALPGQSILDTHLGGATIVEAVDRMNKIEKMSLHITACEIDQQYFQSATHRIRKSITQTAIPL